MKLLAARHPPPYKECSVRIPMLKSQSRYKTIITMTITMIPNFLENITDQDLQYFQRAVRMLSGDHDFKP